MNFDKHLRSATAHPKLRNVLRLTRDIVYFSDTTQLRWLMGVASCVWGISMLSDAELFDRPIHRLMVWMVEFPVGWVAQLASHWWPSVPWATVTDWATPREVWGLSFIAYGLAALWRIYEGKPRLGLGFLVNLLGFVLWFGSTMAMSLSLGRFSLAMIVEGIMSLQLLIITIRTGLNDDMTSP